MADHQAGSEYATQDQIAYAQILDLGMRIGLGALVVCFLIYVSGLLPPQVPLDQVSQFWSQKAHDYLVANQVPVGWGWLRLAGKGDFLNFLPIAFLSAVTIACYARILPMLLAAKDRVYAGIAVMEILVLVLAASGILAVGH